MRTSIIKASNTLRNAAAANYVYYQSQHRTSGCKITHMVGVPMIAISFLMLPFNFKRAALMHAVGWALQLIGHYVFEKNKPVFLEIRNPLIMISALRFTYSEWKRVVQGEKL